MPKLSPPPAAAKSTVPVTKPTASKQGKRGAVKDDRPIVYPELQAVFCCEGGQRPPIDYDTMKKILGWENEDEYSAALLESDVGLRKLADSGPEGLKAAQEKAKFADDAPVLLKDTRGRKVVCWHDARNRPLDESHAYSFAQRFLNREMIGPLTVPGETVNGESFIISRRGEVTSGQHRGIGYVIACEMWMDEETQKPELPKRWHDKWPTMPVFETLLVTGASDHPKVLASLDNVKPRTLADTLYTSELFATVRIDVGAGPRPLSPGDRKDIARMTDAAIDVLWKRTKAGGAGWDHYQTHAASRSFLDNHKTLLKCICHIFQADCQNVLSGLKLTRGAMAAAMYLMACSDSDKDKYYAAETQSERNLNFEQYDKAEELFTLLAGKDITTAPIREALALLVSSSGSSDLVKQRNVVLSKAWARLKTGEKLTVQAIMPLYETDKDKDGNVVGKRLAEHSKFGGIDIGDKKRESDDAAPGAPPNGQEIQKGQEQLRKESADRIKQRLMERHQQELAKYQAKWPNRVLVIKGRGKKANKIQCFGNDATIMGDTTAAEVIEVNGIAQASASINDLDTVVTQLVDGGYKVAVLTPPEEGQDEPTATLHQPKAPASAK